MNVSCSEKSQTEKPLNFAAVKMKMIYSTTLLDGKCCSGLHTINRMQGLDNKDVLRVVRVVQWSPLFKEELNVRTAYYWQYVMQIHCLIPLNKAHPSTKMVSLAPGVVVIEGDPCI